jgi:hypothetical protein
MLIRQMSLDNPLWGAPRIHGELLKLGYEVAQSTVAKYMVRRRGRPGQDWGTFLHNHASHVAAIDLFVVPTLGFLQRSADTPIAEKGRSHFSARATGRRNRLSFHLRRPASPICSGLGFRYTQRSIWFINCGTAITTYLTANRGEGGIDSTCFG